MIPIRRDPLVHKAKGGLLSFRANLHREEPQSPPSRGTAGEAIARLGPESHHVGILVCERKDITTIASQAVRCRGSNGEPQSVLAPGCDHVTALCLPVAAVLLVDVTPEDLGKEEEEGRRLK